MGKQKVQKFEKKKGISGWLKGSWLTVSLKCLPFSFWSWLTSPSSSFEGFGSFWELDESSQTPLKPICGPQVKIPWFSLNPRYRIILNYLFKDQSLCLVGKIFPLVLWASCILAVPWQRSRLCCCWLDFGCVQGFSWKRADFPLQIRRNRGLKNRGILFLASCGSSPVADSEIFPFSPFNVI